MFLDIPSLLSDDSFISSFHNVVGRVGIDSLNFHNVVDKFSVFSQSLSHPLRSISIFENLE